MALRLNQLLALFELIPELKEDELFYASNPNISWDYIMRNEYLKNNLQACLRNPNMPLELLLYDENLKDLDSAALHPKLTLEIVASVDECYNWDTNLLTRNPNFDIGELFTWGFLSYKTIFRNAKTDIKHLFKHIVRDYQYKKLSRNPNMTWEHFKERHQDFWDWKYVSKNSNITWEIIKDNPNKPWDWYYVSQNPNITWEIIQSNPDKQWDWTGISLNPNITASIVINNMDKPWVYDALEENIFDKHPVVRRRNIQRRYFIRWQGRVKHNKKIREIYRACFDSVLDMLKLRIRDFNIGVRSSMI